jgi:molecular chaperone DnaK (HSP70)
VRAVPQGAAIEPEPSQGGRPVDFSPQPAQLPAAAMPVVRFVTAHGVGIKLYSGGQWINQVLIAKNTPVPARVTRQFLTQSAGGGGRDIQIDITQGDTSNLALAELLGRGKIKGLPGDEPAGQPVELSMAFDQQGRLHIRALYVPRRQEMEMTLDVAGGLRPEEVAGQRRLLEQTGFFPPLKLDDLLKKMDEEDDDDASLPFVMPVD